jgi:spermidine synthase
MCHDIAMLDGCEHWARRDLLVGLGALLLAGPDASAKPCGDPCVQARRRTRFGELTIVDRGPLRVLEEDGKAMSAIVRDDPEVLVYPYLEMLAAVAGPPGRALVIGVGGGALSRWLARAGFTVTGVELNRGAIRLARRWLALDDSVRIVVAEGRSWLERHDGPWDLVVLDASSEDYIPPGLLSVEWFTRVSSVLAPGGRAVMNSWANAPRADDELATWRAGFPDATRYLVDAPDAPFENRVLVALREGPLVPAPLDGAFALRVRPLPSRGQVRRDVAPAGTTTVVRP